MAVVVVVGMASIIMEGALIIIDIIFITKIAMSDNNSLSQLLSWVNN